MPRKVTSSLQRKVMSDRKYQSILVQRLINKSMLNGKKQVAERAVYAAIEGAAKKLNSENPVEVLEKAIANISPDFEVKSRRVGGANYQIPFPIAGHRQLHFAMMWIVSAARARSGMSYAKRLEHINVEFTSKVGSDGRMFGTISPKEIVAGLKEQWGIEVDKRKFIDKYPANAIGYTRLQIELYHGSEGTVVGTVNVHISEEK